MFNWLKIYQELEGEIAYIEFDLQRSQRELKRWVSGDLQDVRLTTESEGAKVEERIASIEYELAHKMNDLYGLKKLILTFKGLEHQIMYGKYVEGKRLDEIAKELNYSAQYIYNKHAEIKGKLEYSDAIKI
ncbi:hypothetical protein CN404_19490 [Bacillus thuringiensis]|uniref:hypothetical protein n=1 Tax=Bacillus thuringiensis TaxID=1428 RepID=UPI000BF62D05|nr:hypothetical protein [Bacillus thuringiensis]PFB52551.1 hypothetical protein CN404_19490 [Bacillus thuringiensis]